jgi:DNA-binding NtrC family response regulator
LEENAKEKRLMNVLFLDDSHHRLVSLMDALSQMDILKNINIDYAPSAQQAIDKLSKDNKYNMIFLDHDLEDFHYSNQSARERTGQEVAQWIADNKIDCDFIMVHSWNPQGSKRMVDIMKDKYCNVVYLPFDSSKIANIIKENL